MLPGFIRRGRPEPRWGRAIAGAIAVSLAAAAPARALVENYFVAPGESHVELGAGSGFTIDLGGGNTSFAPFTSQLGIVLGATGQVLPGIGASDGLQTSLGGQLRADVTATTIAIQRGGTAIVPAASGTWAPGIPATPDVLAAAPFGVAFASQLGFTGTAAVRGTAFTLNALPVTLTPQTATSWRFDVYPLFSLLGGVVDFDTDLAGVSGRGFLDPSQQIFPGVQSGFLEELGGGARRLTLPFDISFTVGSDDLGNFPLEATLVLSGRIVAYNRAVPEPSTAVLVALGGITLGLARRAGRGGRSDA